MTITVFDNVLITKCKEPYCLISIDTYDVKALTYCLVRRYVGSNDCEVLLVKKMSDKKQFEEEVKNISKYFDAVVITEEGIKKMTDDTRI